MQKFYPQLKVRRKQLGLKQADMHLRTGISQQQYQRIESKGNPRLDTLLLIVEGLDAELMLIPKEKLREVKTLLSESEGNGNSNDSTDVSVDPWASGPCA